MCWTPFARTVSAPLSKSKKFTPAIDRIAREGTRFENAFAVAPWTLPSHATLFTGLAPSQHEAVHENFVLGPQYLTLAEFLKTRDYVTHGISSNPWVTEGRGLAQGFDHFEMSYEGSEEVTDKGAKRATDLAIEFLSKTAASKQPFFLFVNYLEAHLPYDPPAEGFAALGIDPATLPRQAFTIREAEEIISGKREASEAELGLAHTLYLAEVAYQDRQILRLIQVLRDRKLLDETLLVVTADHGEELGRAGMMGHEFTLSDAGLRVPLVFRYPAVVAGGQRVRLPVSHLDVVPTILHAIDEKESAAALEGRSLLELEALSHDRALLAEYAEPVTLLNGYWKVRHPEFDTNPFAVSLRSLRRGPSKLIENTHGEVTLIDSERPTDASPTDDAAREGRAREMREELGAWISRLRRADPQ